ncbi:MAG: sigma-70 family RNA polymerase sigma factor [Planctomycetes bacterium]|nr:sigma-70 family RNA polymerase sigma factor [Planctomycetota bacterium]
MHTSQVQSQCEDERELEAAWEALRTAWPLQIEPRDEAPLRALCARVEGAVRRLAGRALRASFELEDLCQEGLVALLISSRRAAEEDPRTRALHLHQVLRARMIDLARRRSARKRAEASTALLGDLEPRDHERALARESADPLAEPELLERVAVELAALPCEQRLALEARVFEGLATSAIAERMHRSEEAVRQLLLRARRQLRRALEAR